MYDGWTAYPLMALGNGAGGPPAGYAVQTPEVADDPGAPDASVRAKYTMDNDKQTVTLELSHGDYTSTYSVPQQLFKDKFLPAAIAAGDLAADDKQVAQASATWTGPFPPSATPPTRKPAPSSPDSGTDGRPDANVGAERPDT
jgi:hypothetical protein